MFFLYNCYSEKKLDKILKRQGSDYNKSEPFIYNNTTCFSSINKDVGEQAFY